MEKSKEEMGIEICKTLRKTWRTKRFARRTVEMDMEKVINELIEHIESALAVDSDYVDCVRTDLLQTVVGLLKEQEAVEPIPPKDESDLWRCGNCNHQLFRCTHQRYCEMCGKAVKWE